MLCFSLKGLLFLERTREEKERGRVIKRKRDVEKRESEEEKKKNHFLVWGEWICGTNGAQGQRGGLYRGRCGR